jgi:GT2 family glycosyltransferase
MRLSIIIVNYNVEHFLEQCLLSVRKACEGLDAEVIVVDNASVDGSTSMVRERFPEVLLIANEDNRGFSRANNQGIKQSKGEYVLLLNPDTVVEEETFRTCISFMDQHQDCGGLGIRMLDGKGNFLPESKRGLPTPEVAFYKIFGLSTLFPRSKRFARYHLGYLDEHETHEVEILSGAYMFMRKSALDKVGLLDEEYFMYGEDIDLSYRLIKGGYKNYYLPEARIIHYKGESTKKTSVNYVFVFYNAMRIFARKHFSARHAKSFNKLIEVAIYARAGLSLIKRFFLRIAHPLLDFMLLYSALLFGSHSYETKMGLDFPPEFTQVVLPIYTAIWVCMAFLSSSYELPLRSGRKVQGVIIGTATILILYSLLPEEFRYSRAMILIGALLASVTMLLSNTIIRRLSPEARKAEDGNRRFLILGSKEEQERIALMMSGLGIESADVFNESPLDQNESLQRIKDITEVHGIGEVIFCAKDLSAERIIDLMSRLDSSKLDYKIAPPESLFIIGSNSKDNSGDLLTYEVNAIAKPVNKRNKRLLDLSVTAMMLLAAPLLGLMQRAPKGFIFNLFDVILARKTWVGYHIEEAKDQKLPEIKKSVLFPDQQSSTSSNQKRRSNLIYAKDYSVIKDLDVILKNWRSLGTR